MRAVALLAALALGGPAAALDLALSDEAGAPRALAEFRGRPTLVVLWSTRCAPCRVEIPALDRAAADFAAAGVALAPVALDRAGAPAARAFYDRFGVRALPVFAAPAAAAAAALGEDGLPLAVLLGADGAERGRLRGFTDWDDPATRAEALDRLRD